MVQTAMPKLLAVVFREPIYLRKIRSLRPSSRHSEHLCEVIEGQVRYKASTTRRISVSVDILIFFSKDNMVKIHSNCFATTNKSNQVYCRTSACFDFSYLAYFVRVFRENIFFLSKYCKKYMIVLRLNKSIFQVKTTRKTVKVTNKDLLDAR